MHFAFEWDEEKARRNERNHGVTFEEGRTVFNDRFAISIVDPDHSDREERWIDIGFSSKGRLVVVWYTDRNDVIRIIGCREASPAEEKKYTDERLR